MSNIRTTVVQAMQSAGLSGYADRAEPVITALERQAAQAADTIRRAASQRGIRSAEVEQVLQSSGLVERPAPVAQGGSNAGLEQRVRDLEARLGRAEAAARRHGVTL